MVQLSIAESKETLNYISLKIKVTFLHFLTGGGGGGSGLLFWKL